MRSLIRGSRQFNTIGLVCNQGCVSVRECEIEEHTRGGLLIWGGPTLDSFIIANSITGVEKDAVVLLGEDFKPRVFNNRISKSGVGIRVGIGCGAQICKNNVSDCRVGIETISSEPMVSNNHIEGCLEFGIHTSTYKKLRNDTRIKRNSCIAGCRKSGILCSGLNNFTKIDYNHAVSYNKEAGIWVQEGAHIHVYKNKIMRNLRFGVFVLEGSSAIV